LSNLFQTVKGRDVEAPSRPELDKIRTLVRDFADELRFATTMIEVNIAAGVLFETLKAQMGGS
jgi:hypothetical protein